MANTWRVLNSTLTLSKLRDHLASYSLRALDMESSTKQVDDCSVNEQQYSTSDGRGGDDGDEADDHESRRGQQLRGISVCRVVCYPFCPLYAVLFVNNISFFQQLWKFNYG